MPHPLEKGCGALSEKPKGSGPLKPPAVYIICKIVGRCAYWVFKANIIA